ncbi:SRPBCC family protein [Aquibaculum arenosum]|uniref:SRPBCC family protein n=1 Tax=Aquibaculum arenosum TaxID=3032591 RepID=A0ABT5YKC6_9PROT|nr:SRPBCC family protein [Fodinicurvata sp. CAU 1616]MDF2095362.1 SRPBCC family protein [Fodinicurvata sp. CAU 1616]
MSSSEGRLTSEGLNVHPLERLLSLGVGACLLRSGWRDSGVGGCLKLILGGALAFRGLSGHCHLYEALSIDSRGGFAGAEHGQGWQEAQASAVIERPASELYARWRNVSTLPQILSHVEKVEPLDGRNSRWTVTGPGGARLQFTSRIEQDEPNRRITWRSSEDADVQNEGSVEFQSEGEGRTRIKVHLRYLPPGGALGRMAARLFGGNAESRLASDVNRFKQAAEAEMDKAGSSKRPSNEASKESGTGNIGGGPSTGGPASST